MSTTTIRLSEELKTRIARAAERAGTSAHNFMLEAIAEKAETEDRRADFHAVAEQRHAAWLASGESVPWSRMRGYLEDRMHDTKARHPGTRKPR